MHSVYKYPIPIEDTFTISMPAGATVLTVQTQQSSQDVWRGEAGPNIWVLVDPTALHEPRHFRLAGTGHPIEEKLGRYVGTFQLSGGQLVFHLFEM